MALNSPNTSGFLPNLYSSPYGSMSQWGMGNPYMQSADQLWSNYQDQDPFFGAANFNGTPGAPGTGDSSGDKGKAFLGLVQGIGGAYMGMQQYGLAKKMFAENKRQYEQNYAAQRQMTNAQLEDRQRARIAANPGAYQSVGEYMNQYGIK